ncbi:Lrp/AsnC family transcriptional regulator [archaeon]|jgi:DNA-binding Lrp family transcriptional regulator|nr:Lrp/AsnC family transcriptional regulator [archaeon]MBT4022014.1 Lrp/AsnC family transcriptional regulator [archaeon]MBT4273171.1 Lrp/AsnC family transcriptional regulator [archaeon]MBT4460876.1 Lrp/AsnC family transcriptional regulator [archaeon]MBT4858604.1 Lrp/AsnC family transcriptional regulator [archaeon]
MNIPSLDIKDKKILYQLESNSRQPLSSLAKKVGLSREVVAYRIKQLEQKGIIHHYVTVIDFVRLGYMFLRIFFRYNNVSEEIQKQMVDTLRKDKNVAWMGIGVGDFDLGFVYITKNINILETSYYDFLIKYSNYFKEHDVSFALKIFHFNHTYLHDVNDRNPLIVGKNKEVIELDESEKAVLYELMKNPKISLINLSTKLKMAIKTISNKIQKLEDEKVILNYGININTSVLNLEHHKIYLYLQNITQEKINMLITFISQLKEVIYVTIPLGRAYLEFELVVSGSVELYKFMRTLSITFPQLIRDYDDVFIYSQPFTNYIPE